MTSTQQIVPCLWFDGNGADAAKLYTSLFENSKILTTLVYNEETNKHTGKPVGSPFTVEFEIAGLRMLALNGGPMFKIDPSISLFVICETEAELDRIWTALAEGGTVMMPRERQEWSEKFGWLADRFGLNWQLSLGKISDVGQKITPSFLFVGENYGRAEAAIELYTSTFSGSSIDGILKHPPGGTESEKAIKHAQFALHGEKFMLMENSLAYDIKFSEGFSLMIFVDTQEEIDYFWTKLIADGGQESQCGWLKDKFGVSWQVVPSSLTKMISDPDAAKAKRVTSALMQMQKLDLAMLERAYQGS